MIDRTDPRTCIYREAFEYQFSALSPDAAHVDPPAVAVYQTLLVRGPDGGPAPALAEAWSISDDEMAWDLRLAADRTFHSGAPVTATEVVSTLEALREECLPGDRQLWYWDPVARIDALDTRTIRFHLHHPYPRLFTLLWGTHTAIHEESERRLLADDFGRRRASGTGPYRLQSWDPQRIHLVRDREPDHGPGSMVFTWLPTAADRCAALLEDEVDCAHALDAAGLAAIEGDPRFVTRRQPQPSNMYLALDWTRADLGFNDVRVRQAISMSIDRERLVHLGLDGLGTANYGPLPPGLEFNDPIAAAGAHDPRAARALLDAAGWSIGTDGMASRNGFPLTAECVIQDDPVFARVFTLVAEDLRAIGIELAPRPVPAFAAFYAAVQQHPAASISKWLWPDPVEALIGFTSTSTAPFPNWQRASSPDLDAAFDRFTRAMDAREHQAAASRVQQVFVRDLPYIPLLTPDDIWAWNIRVQGFVPRLGDLYPRYDGLVVSSTSTTKR